MSRADFLRLTGPRLVHVTAAENRLGLSTSGLLSPCELARAAGLDPETLLLRADPVRLDVRGHTAILNHQRPLRAGRDKPFLEEGDLRDWARQLDRRIFLWPGRARAAFARSVAGRSAAITLTLDAGRAYDALADRMDLCAINSGNGTRRPVRRGAWIYVPAREAERFAGMRRARGLKDTRDTVAEVSVRGGIDAAMLRDLAVEPF